MNKLLITLLLLLPFVSLAQPGVAPTEVIDGKKFYKHEVEAGNTLWGLQRMYGVSVDEIMATNPSLKDGLREGVQVLIPVTQASIDKIPTETYKVKKQETLYGLSRKFNISVDDLIALNPELKDGLKKGQIIKVPLQDKAEEVPVVQPEDPEPTSVNPFVSDTLEKEDGSLEQVSITFSDSTVRHIVMAHETMYSISKRFMVPIEKIMETNGLRSTSVKEGQVLVIPVKSERIERVEVKPVPLDDYDPEGEGPLVFAEKERYKVVMLLPFNLNGGSAKVSNLATQFYMGAKIALDSLEKKGLNLDVQVIDSRNDSTHVANLLKDSTFLSTDLFIGPFFKKTVSIVSDYCREHKIRMVVPASLSNKTLEGNRLVYQSIPSGKAMMELLAVHMAKHNANDRIVLIKPTKKADMVLYDAYKEAFNGVKGNVFKSVLVESTIDGFNLEIRRGVNTLFVVPTNDRTTVMKFMNNLNRSAFRSKADDLFVYGTKEWNNFPDINNMYKNKYNFHYAAPNFLDYYAEPVVELNKIHRGMYKTDLSRMAVHGYDLLTYYCLSFFAEEAQPTLMMSNFQMEQLSPKDGYANKGIYVIEQEEYELFDSQKSND